MTEINAQFYDHLQQANQKLRELDRLKSNFFANISHELRTPLTSLLGYTRMFIDGELGDLNADQQEAISVIEKQGRHLLTMIDNLLDVTRLEAGQMILCRTTISLKKVVTRVVLNLRPLADEKGLQLTDNVPGGLPDISGDRERVGQILTNLITNAIKFTSAGSITLSAVPDKEWIRISVNDTGIGIPADHLPNIFDRFYQVNGGSTRPATGTGLGLSIVKELVELHGGSVTVESKVGVGTTFMCTLPTVPSNLTHNPQHEN